MRTDRESELKLQAYLDGELSETESREVRDWLVSEPEAANLLAELENTNGALAEFEQTLKAPETREFYWSRIAREIERLEKPAPEAARVPWGIQLQRMLMPAAAIAMLVMGGLAALRTELPRSTDMETAMSDTGSFVYHDYDAGATLIWFSYPSDNEVAKNTPAATLP